MLLYYITDRKQFPGGESAQCAAMLRRVAEAAAAGVDLIQLREKDLPAGKLEQLARETVCIVREHSSLTRLLINSRTDVALATGADGVHLTANDISASDVRALASICQRQRFTAGPNFLVAVSCHSVDEVRLAESQGADFVVLAPIFEKAGTGTAPVGLEALRSTTPISKPDLRVEAGDNRMGVPVLALGGVNLLNAAECLRAGAAGVAGIRLFQQGSLTQTVLGLRKLGT